MPGFWGYSADGAHPGRGRRQPAHARGRLRRRGGADARLRLVLPASRGHRRRDPGRRARDRAAVGRRAAVGAAGAARRIDQEGGTVQRLSVGVDAIPSAAYVGSTGDLDYARQVARENGETLADLGVTMVMAPVADVDPDGGVGARDPHLRGGPRGRVADGGRDARGLPRDRRHPRGQALPGLGTVDGDSHSTLPVQDKSLQELQDFDLRPFKAAIEAEAPVVMTGHVAVPALDPGDARRRSAPSSSRGCCGTPWASRASR